jgi:MFS family permease
MGGMGLTGAALAPFVHAAITHFGINHTFLILAAVYAFILTPLLWWLLPSGRTGAERTVLSDTSPLAPPVARRAVIILGIAGVFIGVATVGGVGHLVPLLKDMHATSPALAATVVSLTVMVSRPLVGTMIDRMRAQWVGAGTLLLAAAGMALVALLGADYALFCGVLLGIALGAEADVLAYLTSKYVAPARYTRAFSWIYILALLGMSGGPLGIALLHDQLGNYNLAYMITAGVSAVGGLLLLFLPSYKPTHSEGPPIAQATPSETS